MKSTVQVCKVFLELPEKEFSLLILLCWITKLEEQHITVSNINYYLYGDKPTKDRNKFISDTMDSLIKNNYISGEILSPGEYLIYNQNFAANKEHPFIIIDMDIYFLLMRSKLNNKYSLVKYLAILINSFNYNIDINGKCGIIGHMPISFLATKMRKSHTTISSYTKILEDLKIIYVFRSKDNNIYSLYKNRELIILYLNKLDIDGIL